ncbi:hypothetical protein [Ahniella affigens]|nr:hypothetical protein [Ahniella affigens]
MKSVVLVLCGILVWPAFAAASDPTNAPSFSLTAPAPSMILVTLDDPHHLEWQREPPIRKRSRFVAQGSSAPPWYERHDATPGTDYRYRGRRKEGEWSAWQTIHTPSEAEYPPATPVLVLAQFEGRFVINFEWQAADSMADGFVLIRCRPETPCDVAGVMNPDERRFQLVTWEAGTYRLAAFNSRGYSAFTADTAMLGVDEEMESFDDNEVLRAEDSLIAKDITKINSEDVYSCTTPTALMQEGWVLEAVREDRDLWYEPNYCGTGGCIWYEFQVLDGCYMRAGSLPELLRTAPYSSKEPRPGIRISSSGGSAYSGVSRIYEYGELVAQFDWLNFEPPFPGLKPPFDEYGTVQFVGGTELSPE